ncbi:MAG: fibrobacter succinogenes major paralogous domain-containing protein, partial [Prevotella sp.]|nr:fibrobacter succinogenes major paralogous domain-containing protein [Prevotella sp.]
SVGKIRQDYKITLPKTTYPINGTLTIKEMDESKGTGNKKIFNITSVPVYEGTVKPVLVEGNYSPDLVERRYWAPVNVGSTSTTYSANVAGRGYYFQWGRSYAKFGTYDSSGDTVVGPLFADEAASDTNKSKVITSADGDWLKLRENEEDDRWQGDNAQGPCPNGWRVPTAEDLEVLVAKASSFGSSRLTITGVGGNLYLPTCGERGASGTWANAQSTWGNYWSSTVDGTIVKALSFNSSSPIIANRSRAGSLTVRCIQE